MRIRVWLRASALAFLAWKEEDLPDAHEEPRTFTLPLPPSTAAMTWSTSSSDAPVRFTK